MVIFTILLGLGLVIAAAKFGFIALVFGCLAIDLSFIFFTSMYYIDPWTETIAGSKFGHGLINVFIGLVLVGIYLFFYLKLAKSQKLKPIFVLWNIVVSFYGAWNLYEALAYIILPMFDVTKTAVIPIFKWRSANVVVYYIIITIIGIIISGIRLSYFQDETPDIKTT